MTSSPVLSPVVVLVALKLLGGSLTLVLLGSALVGSLLIGWVGNRILPVGEASGKSDDKQFEAPKKTFRSSFQQWLHWSFFELGAHVSVELIIGLSIATVFLVALPIDFVAGYLGGQSVLSILLVIVLGIPVYACSVPSVPIVHSLLLMGASPGTAVAYMIAGPATNLGELNAIRSNMGTKSAVYYAVALVSVALAAGTVTDRVFFSDYEYLGGFVQGKLIVEQCCVPVLFEDSSQHTVSFAHVGWLKWVSGAILFVVMCVGVAHEIREFLVNPCKNCIWRAYQSKNRCAAKCHVRRKHDWIRGKRRRAMDTNGK